MLLIGEGNGGCNADDELFQRLADEWEEIGDFSIPQWPGIHDYIALYRRKTARTAGRK